MSLEAEIERLNGKAYRCWQNAYSHNLGWTPACVANLTVRNPRDGKRIVHLADEMLNRIAKLMDTHLHVFFGSREDGRKRGHLHLVIFTEESLCPIGTQKLILHLNDWERYGCLKRQDIDQPRGGNFMGYVINKNDGEESHFLDRFYCPKTGACAKRKRNKSRCIYKHRA